MTGHINGHVENKVGLTREAILFTFHELTLSYNRFGVARNSTLKTLASSGFSQLTSQLADENGNSVNFDETCAFGAVRKYLFLSNYPNQ